MSFENLIAQLDATDETDRMYAAEDLGYADAAEGINPLLERLPVEQSAVVREAITSALDRISHPDVITPAIEFLDHEQAFVRNAMTALLRRRGAQAHGALATAFPGSSADRRKFILDTFSGAMGEEVDATFAAALRDDDVNVVITAVEHIGSGRRTRFKSEVEWLLGSATEPMLLFAVLETLAEIGDSVSLTVAQQRFHDGAPVLLEDGYNRLSAAVGGACKP